MAVFNEDSFVNLVIPIYGKEDVLETYNGEFKKIFKGLFKHRRVDLEKLIKYVIYMYDKNSPMRDLFSDINIRKNECAILAGYDLSKHEKKLTKIFNLTDKDIMEMLYNFLKYQNNKAWALLTSNEEGLWQYQKELLTPIVDFRQDKEKLQALEVKAKLMNECDMIVKRIENYEEKIFGDDDDIKNKIKQERTSPESIAYVQKT